MESGSGKMGVDSMVLDEDGGDEPPKKKKVKRFRGGLVLKAHIDFCITQL